MASFLHANLFNVLILMLQVNLTTVQSQKTKLVPYSIPNDRALKKSLGYYEDTYLNFTELATKYGYASEQHEVTTQDGYILTVFRILPKCSEVQVQRNHPVLLQHGVMDSSDVWIVAGRKTGLGYVLSDNCYDVWAANHRGNRYSRKHIRFNPDTDAEYWNFSFDEHGNYDLPALVDYVLYMTKRPRIFYIGHSQGTTNFFVMNSLRPEYNQKIQLSIHLAPVAWLRNIDTLPVVVAQGTEPIRSFLVGAGYSEIFGYDQILHNVLEFLCQRFPDAICGELLTLTSGYKWGTIRSHTLSIAFGHLLVGLSTKGLAHFGQLIVSKKFRRFDEGRAGNIKRYGTPKPPNYNISLITSPVVLINAKSDMISSLKDIAILESRLPNVIENYVVPEQYWSHHNHVYGIKAPIFVYPKILDYFGKFDGPFSFRSTSFYKQIVPKID